MRPCEECGTSFEPPHVNTRMCSNRCRNARRERARSISCSDCGGRMWASHTVAANPRCQPCRRSAPSYRDRTTGRVDTWTCADCGAPCERPATKGQRPKWCEECRTKSRKRDWIPRSVRHSIYDRDAWMCWLCEERVIPDLIGTRSPWRPSLDHVVPRSLRGSNGTDNLRLAHTWCNTVRNDGRAYSPEDFRVPAA